MPMLWRRIAWLISFAAAVALAIWMRSADYGWLATLGAAFAVWVILPFVISQVCAVFVLRAMHKGQTDEIVRKIAKATEGLPPEEQLEIGKRIIDEHFK